MAEIKRLTLEEVQGAIKTNPEEMKKKDDARVAQVLRKFQQATPPLFRRATLKGFDTYSKSLRETHQKAIRYVAEFPEVGLLKLIQGVPGCGKTHLCYAIGREIAALGYVVMIVKLSHLIMDLRSAWRGSGETEEYILTRYRDPALLVIDEISRHSHYGDGRAHLYQVIDHRIEYLRPTIITSNEDDPNLTELLGPALLDRLSLGGKWEIQAQSYRPKLAGEPDE